MKRLIIGLLLVMILAISFVFFNPFKKTAPAGLQVSTNNIKSSVFLNGQLLDKTPLIEKTLKPGQYTIKIVPDDDVYVPYETSITLRSGALTVMVWKPGMRPETSGGVIYEFEPIETKHTSEVSFVSIPDTAIVELEGERKDYTPVIFKNVAPGNIEYTVMLPSYVPQKNTIFVLPGQRMLINVKLAKMSDEPDPVTTTNTLQPTDATDSAQVRESPQSGTDSADKTDTTVDKRTTINTRTVKILTTNFFVEGKEVLRVRSDANSNSSEVGYVMVGEIYAHTGNVINSWYEITFDDKTGWVSGQFAELAS